MPNLIYRRGANFERRVKQYLVDRNWTVLRSAGSHTPIDLIAFRQGEVQLIQCKLSGNISSQAKTQLLEIAKENGFRAFIASRNGKEIEFMELEG